jgi:hypothetical protein
MVTEPIALAGAAAANAGVPENASRVIAIAARVIWPRSIAKPLNT